MKEQERSVAWLARKIYMNDAHLGRLLRNNRHIHSSLIYKISESMRIDFFAYFSEQLEKNISSC
ncbi:MAG: hypothetical protein LBR13_06715 [Dysgonamonadaceae bacterium]|nr:hypothetical protein [Dysgonamonadaceae bacterium]